LSVVPDAAWSADRTCARAPVAVRPQLLIASYPELDASSLLDADAPADPTARLDAIIERHARQVVEHEPDPRSMLRLSLESPPPDRTDARQRASPAGARDARDRRDRGARLAHRRRRALA
jgi:hypothetical protein